jgi:hypothetical protein
MMQDFSLSCAQRHKCQETASQDRFYASCGCGVEPMALRRMTQASWKLLSVNGLKREFCGAPWTSHRTSTMFNGRVRTAELFSFLEDQDCTNSTFNPQIEVNVHNTSDRQQLVILLDNASEYAVSHKIVQLRASNPIPPHDSH